MNRESSEAALEVTARWIVTMNGPPIKNGSIVIRGSEVVSIGNQPRSNAIDLGDYAILPSLVNSHTHFEFSDLTQPIVPQGNFATWIAQVIEHRRQQREAMSSGKYLNTRRQAYQAGVRESIERGVGLVVDMITQPWQVDWQSVPSNGVRSGHSNYELDIIALAELLGVTVERFEESLVLTDRFNSAHKQSPSIQFGLCPHAPYTAPWALVESAVRHSRNNNGLVSMHLAESREELEWIDHRTGPLAELLENRTQQTSLFDEHHSIADHIRLLGQASRGLIVHGNYLDSAAIEQLQANRDHLAVVYCPRTHALFQHDPHPVQHLLQKGIQVFLGTDSRASNPDLSIMSEARAAHNTIPSIPAETWLTMITSGPATFLRATNRSGQIRVGCLARFSMVPSKSTRSENVYDEILDSTCAIEPLRF